ncbi:MAG: flagellar protein FlgN [Verrucomicrobiae bacterium]|nr:flagellar protein FlgN [Verrucomicrobiae bacterium]
MIYTPESAATILLTEHDSLAELLRLVKEEQQLILNRKTEPLLAILQCIEEQLLRVRQNQEKRDAMFKCLLEGVRLPNKPGLAIRTRYFPESIRLQTSFLAQRIDTLIQLVHEIAWQNHVLLSHSMHFLEQVLSPWLDPRKETVTVYSENGALRKNNKRQNIFQAVA